MTKKKANKSNFKEWIEAISIAVLIVLIFRFFLFDLYVVPTTSMAQTIFSGDFVLVNKYSYGARIPITPLSIPFAHQYLPFNEDEKCYSEIIQLPYTRLPATDSIKQDDILLFNYPLDLNFPVDQRSFYVKRCIALSGQTITLKDKDVLVDQQLISPVSTAKFEYYVKTDGADFDNEELKKLGIDEGGRISNQGDWYLTMSEEAAVEIQKKKFVHKVLKKSEKKRKKEAFISESTYPNHPYFNWTKDNFGPLYIPKKGDTLILNHENRLLYGQIIEKYEGNEIDVVEDTLIFINLRPATYYVFKMNYYFVMGDNRDNSKDSRYWGLVPENHIIGKVDRILFSIDKSVLDFYDRIRWDRTWKKL